MDDASEKRELGQSKWNNRGRGWQARGCPRQRATWPHDSGLIVTSSVAATSPCGAHGDEALVTVTALRAPIATWGQPDQGRSFNDCCSLNPRTREALAHTPPDEPSPRSPRAHLLSDSLLQTIQPSFQHADLHMIPQIRTAKVSISRLPMAFCVLARRRGISGLAACWLCWCRRRVIGGLAACWWCGCRRRTTGPSRLRKCRHAQRCRRGHNNHKTHFLSPAN